MIGRFFNKGVWLAVNQALRVLAVGLLLLGVNEHAVAQDLVQAAVDGLQDGEHARSASQLIQQQPEVLMARFDVRTRNMMLHVTESASITRNQINALLAPLGLQVRCYSRGAARDTPFRHVNAEECGDPLPLDR
ncbi:MAG: hypothetical protein IPK70_15385 [Flavobacteriales bacterium]|nr:hypothetical protein [Flavobacteriales bacterium]